MICGGQFNVGGSQRPGNTIIFSKPPQQIDTIPIYVGLVNGTSAPINSYYNANSNTYNRFKEFNLNVTQSPKIYTIDF